MCAYKDMQGAAEDEIRLAEDQDARYIGMRQRPRGG